MDSVVLSAITWIIICAFLLSAAYLFISVGMWCNRH